MAPPPEYDKEPKAPDKSVISDNCEDSKAICNSSSEQFTISDSKSHNNVTTTDVENNSHVGTLDDGQLRALLDEAITYKCPKDREGKSSLFKELLEEVEQDEQACEAAARELTGSRGKRAGKGRRQLPHSNSLQDLVAALAAESAPRRARAVPVSTRAIHGGSLPSGVDTSFLLSEEPSRGGYLATVRCVNPPPLSERAAAGASAEAPAASHNHRRSKPTTGVTYTARATLEIGGGRAVTTTTASNQVRTSHPIPAALPAPQSPASTSRGHGGGSCRQPRGPLPHTNIDRPHDKRNRNPMLEVLEKPMQLDCKERINTSGKALLEVFEKRAVEKLSDSVKDPNGIEKKAETPAKVKAIETRSWRNSARKIQKQKKTRHSPGEISRGKKKTGLDKKCMQSFKLGDVSNTEVTSKVFDKEIAKVPSTSSAVIKKGYNKLECNEHVSENPNKTILKVADKQANDLNYFGENKQKDYNKIEAWYEELQHNSLIHSAFLPKHTASKTIGIIGAQEKHNESCDKSNTEPSFDSDNTASDSNASEEVSFPLKRSDFALWKAKQKRKNEEDETLKIYLKVNNLISSRNDYKCNFAEQIKYRKHVGKSLKVPSLSNINPKNVKNMTIGKPPIESSQAEPSTSNVFYDNMKHLYKKSKSKDIDKEIIFKSNDKNPQKPFNVVSSVVEKSEDLSKKLSTKSDYCDVTVDSKLVTEFKNTEFIDVKNENETNCLFLKDIDPPITKTDSATCDIGSNNKETQSVAETEVQNKVDVEFKSNAKAVTDGIELMEMQTITDESITAARKDIDIELQDMKTESETVKKTHSFSDYYADQKRLFNILESNNNSEKLSPTSNHDIITQGANKVDIRVKTTEVVADKDNYDNQEESKGKAKNSEVAKPPGDQHILAELPNNACFFLTLPECLLTDKTGAPSEVSNNNIKPYNSGENSKSPGRKPKTSNPQSKMAIDKNMLRNLLYVTLFNSISENSKPGLPTISEVEVDSAIPFNCITTPEVVASCNTTSTTQSAATVDPKPMQLGSCYRAVASLTSPAVPPAPAAPPEPAASDESATSPGVNGLSTSRASDDEYKKSLDENGNSVGGVSPNAGGGKKPRRKRSSRNETVTKSHHIDGYQGNKDLNELLRFIEASAAPRPRRKPPPDNEDKKKRRKATTGVRARAASLESEPAPPAPPPPEPEPEPCAAGFTTVSRRRRSRRKHLSPSPPPPIEREPPAAVVPDLIESHRVRRPPPPAPGLRVRPDLVTARRPAVQLPRAPPPPPGLTFGFDVNHTLLPPPAPTHPTPQLMQLVDYIGHAWEDVIKCLGGKVRYYSE